MYETKTISRNPAIVAYHFVFKTYQYAIAPQYYSFKYYLWKAAIIPVFEEVFTHISLTDNRPDFHGSGLLFQKLPGIQRTFKQYHYQYFTGQKRLYVVWHPQWPESL